MHENLLKTNDANSSSDDRSNKNLSSRFDRFKNLQMQRENTMSLNLEEIKKEDINRQKNNPRLLAKMARKKAKFTTIKAKLDAKNAGISYERIKSHEYTIEETNRWKKHLKEKISRKNPTYADYGDLAQRKYDKLITKMKPDLRTYKQVSHSDPSKKDQSDPFSSFIPVRENISRMVEDVYNQIEKRATFSKKKRFNPDADVTYINERNMRFNQKIDRAYGTITRELRESVEQGSFLGKINAPNILSTSTTTANNQQEFE